MRRESPVPSTSDRPGLRDGKGHVAVTHVASERVIVHRSFRGGTWQQDVILPASDEANVDAMALASVYDKERRGRRVRGRSGTSGSACAGPIRRGSAPTNVPLPAEASGRIAATASPRVGVHCRTSSAASHFACERGADGIWSVRALDGSIASMAAAGVGPGGESVVGWRQRDRGCQVISYASDR